MSGAQLIVFCGLLLSVSAFSCDITLPAFWSMQKDLATSIEAVQAIVPTFLIAQAIGQLVFGPISDRVGRRPVILAGLALYILGTGVAMLASSITMVLAARAAQGFGSACGIAVGRAVLRDISHGPALAQAMALAMAIFALGPISAPLLGYALVSVASWRGIFAGMGVFGTLMLAWALLRYAETNAQPDSQALRARRLLGSLRRVIGNQQSRWFLLTAAATQFTIISFVANGPRLFKSAFGVEGLHFALLFASTGLGIILGQLVNNSLIVRLGVLAATRIAALVLLFVTGTVLSLILAEALSGPQFALLMFAFNTSFLVVMANSATMVIDPHREIAGFASSLYGFVTQIIGSVLALLTVPFIGGRLLPWSGAMVMTTAVVVLALALYRPALPGPAR